MPGSLRFRLPALFLLGIVLAGVVAALIAVQLFQATRATSRYEELGREARGIAQLYGDAALRAADEGRPRPTSRPPRSSSRRATSSSTSARPRSPGRTPGSSGWRSRRSRRRRSRSNGPVPFEFRPPGQRRGRTSRSAAAAPARARRPRARRDRRREAAGRRPRPVAAARRPARRRVRDRRPARLAARSLALAPDQRPCARRSPRRRTRSRTGNYAVHVPVGPRRRRDLPPLRAVQRDGGAAGGDRGARAPVPDVRLARAAHAADRDQGPRRRAPRRADRRPGARSARRSTSSPSEATRLERLVGDVLDLAKLRAHRFTVQTEEVDMGRLVEHAYGSFGDEARRREIDYELDGDPRRRRRSSPTATGCCR